MVTVERYRKTRFWAVYEYGELLCVTVYKKGANAVKSRLEGARIPVALAEEPASCCSYQLTLVARGEQFPAPPVNPTHLKSAAKSFHGNRPEELASRPTHMTFFSV